MGTLLIKGSEFIIDDDTVGWDMPTLRYELAYQKAGGIHTWGQGRCGHSARGSGFCAKCLQAEIDRRALSF